MTVYAAKSRAPEQNYFASIRTASGGSAWEHVRTNLGRKVAYAMIAKHWGDDGKIESFRDENQMIGYDREGLSQGSDGVLRTNVWAGCGGNESRWYGA